MATHMRRHLVWLSIVVIALAAVATALGRAQEPTVADVRARGPDVMRGERLYAVCAACHGVDGAGRAAGEIPAIAGQHVGVLTRQFVAFRGGVRWDVRMEHASQIRQMGDAQAIADVAAYVARLPVTQGNQRGTGEHLDLGARVYAQRCAACHGARGEGRSIGDVPRLAGQHHAYLQRQFLDVLEQRRPGLSESHARVMRGLAQPEIDGIADFLSRATSGG
ncbi:MAG: cytochrome C [Gammaproteobacteria bacterium]|jgi:cytochrome c553|nr:cytochrome C [Gammaproteobacteria bacterium]